MKNAILIIAIVLIVAYLLYSGGTAAQAKPAQPKLYATGALVQTVTLTPSQSSLLSQFKGNKNT